MPETDQKNFDTFTLFLKFPTELRVKIWKASILPRILHKGRDLKSADVFAHCALTPLPTRGQFYTAVTNLGKSNPKSTKRFLVIEEDWNLAAEDERHKKDAKYWIYINLQRDKILNYAASSIST